MSSSPVPETATTHKKDVDASEEGVSLYHLAHDFLQKAEEEKKKQAKDVTIYDIVKPVIMGEGKDDRDPNKNPKARATSYIDSLDVTERGKATHMLSYTWSYKVTDIVDALVSHLHPPQRPFIWICCLCINQWTVEEKKKQAASDRAAAFKNFKNTFESRVHGIKHVLAMMQPWNQPTYVTRVWCDFELFTAVNADKKLDIKWEIIMPSHEKQRLDECLCSGHNQALREVWTTLSEVNIEVAKATEDEDRKNIFGLIEGEGGCGFDRLNLVVSEELRKWVSKTSKELLDLALKAKHLQPAKLLSQIALVASLLTELGQEEQKGAEELLEKGFEMDTGNDTLARAELYQARGKLRCKQQKARDAQKDLDKAMTIRQNQRAREDAEMYRQMGIAKKHQKEYKAALRYYELAIKVLTDAGLKESADAAEVFTNMGALYFDAWHNIEDANDVYLQALRIRNKLHSLETPKGANLLTGLAVLKARCQDYENAIALFEGAQKIFQKVGRSNDRTGRYVETCIAHLSALLALRQHDFARNGSCPESLLLDQCCDPEQRVIKAFLDVSDRIPDRIKPKQDPHADRCFDYQVLLRLVAAAGKILGKDYNNYDQTDLWDYRESRHVHERQRATRVTDIKTMVWNITSPGYAANALEYMPDTGHERWQQLRVLLEHLLDFARKYMFSPIATNQRILKRIIPQEVQDSWEKGAMGVLEGQKLIQTKNTKNPKKDQEKGLKTWLEHRLRMKARQAERALRKLDHNMDVTKWQNDPAAAAKNDQYQTFREFWVWDLQWWTDLQDLKSQKRKELELEDSATGVEPSLNPQHNATEAKDKIDQFFEDKAAIWATSWLENPLTRWEYWKEQSVYDWMRDDNSGGAVNPLLLAEEPSYDDLCWDLGLSSADRAYAEEAKEKGGNNRAARARWLLNDDNEAPKTAPKLEDKLEDKDASQKEGQENDQQRDQQKDVGTKHDYFKLMVWDLIIEYMLTEAEKSLKTKSSEVSMKKLLEELRPAGREKKLEVLWEWMQPKDAKLGVDLAVLVEVPKGDVFNEDLKERFYVVKPKEEDRIMNTVILARKSRFFEPILDDAEFKLQDDRINPRLVSCKLICKSAKQKGDGNTPDAEKPNGQEQELHVVGVHLASNGHDWGDVASQLEPLIRSNTMLAGDFNSDLRKETWPKHIEKALEATPNLKALLQQARQLPTDLGSCCKQRMPFQTQVSKAFHQDFSMKDFVFLGSGLCRSDIQGLITLNQRLPNQDIPSDHAPLKFSVAFQSSAEETETGDNDYFKAINNAFMEKILKKDCLEHVYKVFEALRKQGSKVLEESPAVPTSLAVQRLDRDSSPSRALVAVSSGGGQADYDAVLKGLMQDVLQVLKPEKENKTVETADLFSKMGTLQLDNLGDVEEAMSLYLQALKIRHSLKQLRTPEGASLLMKIGIAKARSGDVENARAIFWEAKRILEQTGDPKDAKSQDFRSLSSCINCIDMLVTFRDFDRTGDGRVSVKVFQKLPGWPSAGSDSFREALEAADYKVGEDTLHYEKLLRFLYATEVPDLWGTTITRICSDVQKTPIVGSFAFTPIARDASSLNVLMWNITSSEFASNALEYLPRPGALAPTAAETLRTVLQVSRELMLSPTDSRKLSDLVEEQELLRLNELETQPLKVDGDQAERFPKWIESRLELLKEAWKETQLDPQTAMNRWLSNHHDRWLYWKTQKVCDWMRDDNSGGKVINPLLLPEEPTIDSTCWDHGLSSADRAAASPPWRLERAKWLRRSEKAEKPSKKNHDYFKLLVWDLLLQKILQEAESRLPPVEGVVSRVDAMLQELWASCPLGRAAKLAKVRELLRQVDLAVLVEVPGNALEELEKEGFWVVRAPAVEPDQTMNTIVLARKSVFEENPTPEPFFLKESSSPTEQPNKRAIGCRLVHKASREEFHVLAVHLASSGRDWNDMAVQLETRLGENTLLAGDFNCDLRKVKLPGGPAALPKLSALLEQARRLPLDLGSCSKQRTPFQTQVSKAFSQDFTMKDFVLLGDAFAPTELSGLVTREQRLPSTDIPSDHAPLTFTLKFKA